MSTGPTRDRMAVASIAHALAHAPIELVADRLAEWEREHADDHPYCQGCPLTQSIAALRTVLAHAEDHIAIADGHDHHLWCEAKARAAFARVLIAEINAALGVTS